MDDLNLISLLNSDPNAGMEKLMDQYAGLVYSVVKNRLADSLCVSSDIEDCVSEVFSDFYIGLEKFNPQVSSIKSYLCVIARNSATDIVRRRSRQKEELVSDDDSLIVFASDNDSAEVSYLEEELRREVLSAIKELGEPDSTIIIRKYYFGESSKQIARSLRLTVTAVDTRAHRALSKIKKIFGG